MFNAEFIKKLEMMANRTTLLEQGQTSIDRAYGSGDAYESGVSDGQTFLARMIIGMSAPVAAVATTSSSFMPSGQNITEGVADTAETVLHFVPDIANTVANKSVREVECIGVCESTGRFVSETPSDGSILDTVGDSLGNIAEGVGDVVGGAFSAVGDVLSSIAD
jgi:hypothetical protein